MHETDPELVVEVTDDDGWGSWSARCQRPACRFVAGSAGDRPGSMEDVAQEAIVHVDCHPH